MTENTTVTKDEKALSALAHASIVLGLFTNGMGGIVASLLIWLVEKEKSSYVAAQALQALVYQLVTFIATMLAWCCWGALWVLLLLPPLFASPEAYQSAPPPGFWAGLLLMLFPLVIWAITILYGLWGAARCLAGHEFRYVIVGRWLDNL